MKKLITTNVSYVNIFLLISSLVISAEVPDYFKTIAEANLQDQVSDYCKKVAAMATVYHEAMNATRGLPSEKEFAGLYRDSIYELSDCINGTEGHHFMSRAMRASREGNLEQAVEILKEMAEVEAKKQN